MTTLVVLPVLTPLLLFLFQRTVTVALFIQPMGETQGRDLRKTFLKSENFVHTGLVISSEIT